MRKNVFSFVATLVLLFSINTAVRATNDVVPTEESIKTSKNVESAEAKAILTRLDEIKAIDKSDMTSKQKKELRKEVRTLRTQLAAIGGGVYISAGALIIILLLILLL